MSKCNKVKNPCKICLKPVTQKTGLKCQGVCSSWVHFSCVNYTPGKIKDIKAGLLKINCPCPDCKTEKGKEYYVDSGLTCMTPSCPAKLPPMCGNADCVTNTIRSATVGTKLSDPYIGYSLGKMTSLERTAGDMRSCSNYNLEADIDQVCNTVGKLTQQLNTLMMNLKRTVIRNNEQRYPQSGPSAKCPNTCFSSGKGKKR